MEVRSFPRAYERRDKFLYYGAFYKEFKIYVKKGLVSGAALSIWPCQGI
jgi:hypothetical protein